MSRTLWVNLYGYSRQAKCIDFYGLSQEENQSNPMAFAFDEKPKKLMQLDREERATATAKQISALQMKFLDSHAEIAKFI